jgi:Uma2 family endonuclease
MASHTLITGEALLHMPDTDKKVELVKGELIEMAPPGGDHGERALRIARLLDKFVEIHTLGRVGVESGFYLARDPDTVRGSDAFFISKERLPLDVAVEVYYTVAKVDEYLAAGVRLVWVIDPKRRTVVVYPGGQTLTEADRLSGGNVLPGFSIPVTRLFRR